MPGGISGRVRFRFYNSPNEAPLGNVVHQSFSDQVLRKLKRANRKLAPLEMAYSCGWTARGELLIRRISRLRHAHLSQGCRVVLKFFVHLRLAPSICWAL